MAGVWTAVRRTFIYPTYASATAASYPLKGVIYFLLHPFLYPLLRGRLLPASLLSIFVLVILFVWTYLPQVAFLALFQHRGSAWVNGTFLVLGESAAIVALLFEAFLVDECQVDIFDAILVVKGFDDLVSERRPVAPPEEGTDPVKRLGRPLKSSVYAPFSFRQIVELVLLLPLNFIPIVGVPLFLFGTGYRAGPFQHWRYFELLDLNKKERNGFIKRRRWQYAWMGTVALTLQIIPVLGMLMLLTTATGAALWAADLEHDRRLREASASQEPEYRDTDEPPDGSV